MLKNLTIFLFFSLCFTIVAQEPIRFSTKQGLPSNHVYDMQEDANGFMWFATNRGLVKYDGENFRTFTIKDGLPNNDTWLLETDYQDRLWYFSKSAYQGYIKNDSIYKFESVDKKVITPRFLYKTKDSLWFHGSSGIQTFNKKNIINAGLYDLENYKKFNSTILSIQEENGFKGVPYMPYFVNPEAKEFIFISKNKLLIYNWDLRFKREIIIDIPLKYSKRKIENLGLLYNQIGFFAMGKGVLFINFKNYTTSYKSFKELVGVEEALYFRCRGLENEFQISIPGHLMVFDYHLNLKKTYAFSENLGRSSFKDNKGNIWLIDLANGVSLIPNTYWEAEYYLQNKKVQKINSIQNDFYAGINDEGFFKFNNYSNTFSSLIEFSEANTEIYQIKKSPTTNQNYFIDANKAYVLKNNKLEWLKIKSPEKYRFNQYLRGIKDIVNFKGSSYFVTGNHFLKNKNYNNFSKLLLVKSGMLFTEAFKKQLFIGGSNGLEQIINDSLVNLKNDNELLKIPISSLSTTKDYLFVGTDGRGVYLYNEEKIIHLKNTDGFSIQKIIKKGDALWLGTDNGVHQLTIDKNNFEDSKITNSFYEADGLLQNNVNDIYIDKDTLYAASDIGLVKLNTKSALYLQKPKLYFKTKSEKSEFAEESRDNISLTFALQDYVNQDNVRYQYRLLPNQKKWTSTQTKTINFSNLNPDSYTLQVKATDQHKNESIASKTFKVVPFWYETMIAKIGFFIFGVLLFLLVLYSIKKRIQLKETEKAEQEKRVAGLELQALRSQMNPHFVHNSLNAIQYFIQRNEVELSENYLSKFSRLIRLFFEYSRKQTNSIEEEIELLENYLSIEKLRFEDKLAYKISIDDKLEKEDQQIPSMILQPIVENAVNHGLFHKKENGNINISFIWLDHNSFKVVIKDDGIGIKKSKEIYKSSAKNYRSSSTDVLKERFKLLEQSNTWKIKYTILDLLEKEEKGTEVSITFTPILL